MNLYIPDYYNLHIADYQNIYNKNWIGSPFIYKKIFDENLNWKKADPFNRPPKVRVALKDKKGFQRGTVLEELDKKIMKKRISHRHVTRKKIHYKHNF